MLDLNDLSKIKEFLKPRMVALHLEQYGPYTNGYVHTNTSEEMCDRVSVFLYLLDGAWGTVEGGNEYRNGRKLSRGGGLFYKGQWHLHYWYKSPAGVIVDLTADQFGAESVITVEPSNPRHVFLRENYRATFSKTDSVEVIRGCRGIAEEWLDQWQRASS